MIKWFVYIAFLWILMPCLSSASPGSSTGGNLQLHLIYFDPAVQTAKDTTPNKSKQQKPTDNKIKEVTKAKHVPKPEKVDGDDASKKVKPKRQRRPPGMERPPEIPRHNGD